ncbi:prepilin-type N-terminal cleavage/methylation domain-containing protein [Candidatus Margulisiibacteriota bacterium]
MKQKGFSLLEMLISLGLLLIIISTTARVRLVTVQNQLKAKMLKDQAISTQNKLEHILSKDFDCIDGDLLQSGLKKVTIEGEILYVADTD